MILCSRSLLSISLLNLVIFLLVIGKNSTERHNFLKVVEIGHFLRLLKGDLKLKECLSDFALGELKFDVLVTFVCVLAHIECSFGQNDGLSEAAIGVHFLASDFNGKQLFILTTLGLVELRGLCERIGKDYPTI